jgi:SAM-dependent methyltransferase
MSILRCRCCEAPLSITFADLGMSPLSNAYIQQDDIQLMEPFYPLHAYVCGECYLVQVGSFETPQRIFSNYAYFSSYSKSWLNHARRFSESVLSRFPIGTDSLVVEVASNDGYLLQYFQAAGIPVLGVEPAANVAEYAKAKGIPTHIRFMGVELANELVSQGMRADLIIGNNVLAHVPDLQDFTAGLVYLLKQNGTLILEFPHLLRLIEDTQYDTIYHEHFSYFSLGTASTVLAQNGLVVYDVEEIQTHGGSLRIYATHASRASSRMTEAPARIAETEHKHGLYKLDVYTSFAERVRSTKRNLLRFLIDSKEQGKQVVGYGAPAKGNTLLNYCGIREDLLAYTVDVSPHKQGRYLPGTHIPIYSPDLISETKPDYVLVLPWNLIEEIKIQMSHIRSWGGKFVVPIPNVKIIP